jgi:hypothetical protein
MPFSRSFKSSRYNTPSSTESFRSDSSKFIEDDTGSFRSERKMVVVRREERRSVSSLPTGRCEFDNICYNHSIGVRGILKYRRNKIDDADNDELDDHSTSNSTIESTPAMRKDISRRRYQQHQQQEHRCIHEPEMSMLRCHENHENDNNDENAAVNEVSDDVSHGVECYDTKARRIQFRYVYIREYARTVGDNPSCSTGAPIT